MLSVKIKGSGVYVPKNKMTSLKLDEVFNLKSGKIESITGVKYRFYAGDNENASDMAVQAINKSLLDASLAIDDIDCVICASGSMEQTIPYNAAIIHSKLKPSKNIPCFDINMTCLSFVAAFEFAQAYISIGKYKRIIITSSEVASVGLNYEKIESSCIFGDGAAAFILESTTEHKSFTSHFETHSKAIEHCQIPSGGTKLHPSRTPDAFVERAYFEMNGKAIFKAARQALPPFMKILESKAGFPLKDIDKIVPHQASQLALSHIQKLLGFSDDKFINIFSKLGNQVAASIPTALHYAIKNTNLKRGDKVLLLGTSAGMSVGGIVFDY